MLNKLILYLGFLLSTIPALSQDIPAKSNTLVTDYTNTLTPEEKALLERKLTVYYDSTSNQIAVVIMKTIGGADINNFTANLGRAWGVGEKGKNNGIVLLIAKDDRKLSIQTGYGAEGAVPDAATHDIITNDLTPRFKNNDYYGGIDAATDDLMKLMKGEFKPDARTNNNGDDGGGFPFGAVIVIVIIVVVIIIRIRGGGGGGHIIGGRGGASPFWWFLAGSALGRGSSGSDWGGFSGGGGSSGGGGFGGF